MITLNLTDSAVRAQFPAAGQIYDTLHQAFVDAPPKTLADACTVAINVLPMAQADRAAILALCVKYGEMNGGSELANTIINDVLYEVWADLRGRYNLPPVPEAEAPAPQTWPGRVFLLQLIADQARDIVHAAVVSRLPLLSEADLSGLYTELDALSVDWGNPPTAEEVDAWRNPE